MFTVIALLAVQPAISVSAPVSVPATDAAQSAAPFGEAVKLDAALLGETTAREDVAQIAQANQAGSVSNNQINGASTTGSVTISDNAFQNLSGLAVINANSGNNVAINSALNVNVNLTRPQ